MLKVTPSRASRTVKITFALPAELGPASVVGDFNDWDPLATPLRLRSNGTRSAAVELPAGHETRFRYLLDGGRWMDEPGADRSGDDCVIHLPS